MSDLDDEEEEGGGGAPGWIMTFADLMSLLLAFFVLLFASSTIDNKTYKEIGGSLKMAFGVQRSHQIWIPLRGINHIAAEFSSGKPDPKIVNVIPQQHFDDDRPFMKQFDHEHKGGSEDNDKAPSDIKGEQTERLQQMAAQKAEDAAREVGEILAKEIAEGQLEVETVGNKMIIRIKEETSFASGSAAALGALEPLIKKVSDALGSSPGRVVVEGHSDNAPIATAQYASNWELSAARAATIVRAMAAQKKLPPERFEVRGMADTRPLASNATPQGRAKNRRVDIVLEYNAMEDVPENLLEKADVPQKKKVQPARKEATKTEPSDVLFSNEDLGTLDILPGDFFEFR